MMRGGRYKNETNLHLLNLFPQRSTISRPVFSRHTDFLGTFRHGGLLVGSCV